MDPSRFSISFTADPSPGAAMRLAEAAIGNGAEALMLLACDENECQPGQFNDWLRTLSVPICGGVFPQLIYDWQNQKSGYLIIGLPTRVAVYNIPGLSDTSVNLHDRARETLDLSEPPESLLVLVDGLSSRIGAFLDTIYDQLGSDPVYIGGGAGSLSFQSRPCLFSNTGMLVNHAQLTTLPWKLHLGVEHGWEKFAGPFVVTDSTSNVIHSLDYRPAFDVYKEHVEADTNLRFTENNFFDIAKAYPFGLEKADGSILVRDPINQVDEDLHCVGEVSSNNTVYLLKGRNSNLIEAARNCAAGLPAGSGPAILTDCISRVLFLEDDFFLELDAVRKSLGERPFVGMLTLGEIANGGDYCLEFYNKTFVLAGTVT